MEVGDLVEEFILEEGLEALEPSQQCWGAMLAESCGCRTSECTAGFVRGKNHLKNKFCDTCRLHGIFVRVDRVWTLPDGCLCVDNLSNGHGAGLWTSMPAHASVGFRLINQSHKCKGPRMIVCNHELPPAASAAWAPLDDKYVIDGRWVHLHLNSGTLVPSLALEFELGDRETKRPRIPDSIDASSASTTSWCPEQAIPREAGTRTLSQPPSPVMQTVGEAARLALAALLTAHAEFGAQLAASLGSQPGLSLSSEQHAALDALLHHVRASEALLQSGAGVDGGGSVGGEGRRTESPSTHAQEALTGVDGLLSWPPSPPGTAHGRRPQDSAGDVEGGVGLSSTALQLPAWRSPPAVAASPRTTPQSTSGRPAMLYFNFLVLCASGFSGQTVMMLLAYLLGLLCDHDHDHDWPIITTYGCVVSVMLAAHFVVAEWVGLVPTGCVRAVSN